MSFARFYNEARDIYLNKKRKRCDTDDSDFKENEMYDSSQEVPVNHEIFKTDAKLLEKISAAQAEIKVGFIKHDIWFDTSFDYNYLHLF